MGTSHSKSAEMVPLEAHDARSAAGGCPLTGSLRDANAGKEPTHGDEASKRELDERAGLACGEGRGGNP